jgi:NADH dehydrogenase
VRATLEALEATVGTSSAFATWEEAELMEISMTSSKGTADVEALGVSPLRMSAVLR